MTAPQANPAPAVRFGQKSEGDRDAPGFGVGGAMAGAALVVLLLGGLLWSAAAGHSVTAQHPHVFGGSLVLEDNSTALPVLDVATGQVNLRLNLIYLQVHATNTGDVEPVPIGDGTMLVNRRTGTFNLLDKDNFLVDTAGPGVGLGVPPAPSTNADGFPAGQDAYIVRYTKLGLPSTVALVDRATVIAGAKAEQLQSAATVRLRGYWQLEGSVPATAGSLAVAGKNLWALVDVTQGCRVVQLVPIAKSPGLERTVRTTFGRSCAGMAIEALNDSVAVAYPGHVRILGPTTPLAGIDVAVPAIANGSGFLPVTGVTDRYLFLARSATGWSIVGFSPKGTAVKAALLAHFSPKAQPKVPVESDGILYTLDQAQSKPTLWTIVPTTGGMASVEGQPTYPVRSREVSGSFAGAQVLVDGPRVVFNNPASLLAVVVFTDGSRAPLVVDKTNALEVSATGPAVFTGPPARPSRGRGSPAPAPVRPTPVVQVNQNITCANTTQKPYQPLITAIAPSSGAALVTWSYQLLSQQDCLPDSWSVTVNALTGSHQPLRPVQTINGQNQLQFTGLRPSTTYQAVVRAFINVQSTASTPVTFTTPARGPDAPATVTTVADGKGNWVVSWTPCASATCIVPADIWTVTGATCGTAYVGQPPSIQVAGTQTRAVINADALGALGDSLTFTVQGALASGLAGDPTSDHSCTTAWRPPTAHVIVVSESAVATGRTITATLQVNTVGATPTEAFGSKSTEFVYHVGTVTVGPTTQPRISVPGLTPGVGYPVSVVVYPSGHPQARVTILAPLLRETVGWPPIRPIVQPQVSPTDRNVGSFIVQFQGAPAQPLSATGVFQCGSTGSPFTQMVVDGMIKITNIDLVHRGGDCAVVQMSLTDTETSSPYGSAPDPVPDAHFTIGTQPTYAFSTQYDEGCVLTSLDLCRSVDLTANQPTPAGGDWSAVFTAPGNGDCAGYWPGPDVTDKNPSFPSGSVTITITTLKHCDTSDPTALNTTVFFTYLGVQRTVQASNPTGPPPSTTTSAPGTTAPTTTTRQPSTTHGQPQSQQPAGPLATQLAAASMTRHADPRAEGAALGAVVAGCILVIARRRRRHGSNSSEGRNRD